MSSLFDNSEIVHEGWLTKSPPTTRIWRARWRKRWFVLKQGGEIPGQYLLCYFTDRNCRKLKGQIDLDQCEQVDAGLRFETRKTKYQHLFDLKTPRRTYYLAADSEDDMNRWVDAICSICGLKTFPPPAAGAELGSIGPLGSLGPLGEEYYESRGESPPISPTSTVSGPYIPISECISGKPLSSPDGLNDFLALRHGLNVRNSNSSNRFQYGVSGFESLQSAPMPGEPMPRTSLRQTATGYRPGNLDLRRISAALNYPGGGQDISPPPLPSPSPGSESVFTDDDDDRSSIVTNSSIPVGGPGIKPSVNWDTFPSQRPSETSLEGDTFSPTTAPSAQKRFTRPSDTPLDSPHPACLAPPRPPKPNHLVTTPTSTNGGCACPPGLSCDACAGVPSSAHSTNSNPPGPVSEGSTALGPSSSSLTPVSAGPVSTGSNSVAVNSGTTLESPSASQIEEDEDVTRSQLTAESKKSSGVASSSGSMRRATNLSGDIFRYDFVTPHPSALAPAMESPPPVYSNLHSPSNLSTPPLVFRELKPGRKHSDSTNSNEASPVLVWGGHGPLGVVGPPNIDRKLKPAVLPGTLKKYDSQTDGPSLKLASPPTGSSLARRKQRAGAPSPVPGQSYSAQDSNYLPRRHSTSDDDVRMMYTEDQVYICNNTKFHTLGYSRYRGMAGFDKIQYLDLDFLDPVASQSPTKPGAEGSRTERLADSRGDLTGTTYKTIDFLKTEAFNRTRQQRQVELVEMSSKQTAQVTQ